MPLPLETCDAILGLCVGTGVGASSAAGSALMVEVEDERPKGVRGARCVSLSSTTKSVST